jgi:hypothetical protein
MLWVSTQYENSIHLVDATRAFKPIYSMKVPRLFHNGTTLSLRLSEPHSVREASDCSVWVTLKGNTREVAPGFDQIDYTEVHGARF